MEPYPLRHRPSDVSENDWARQKVHRLISLGHSGRSLARRLSMGPAALCDWLHGRRRFGRIRLDRIRRLYARILRDSRRTTDRADKGD